MAEVKEKCEDQTLETIELAPVSWDLKLIDHPSSKYSKEVKLRAAETYARTGNVTRTAKAVGVTRELVSKWKNQSAWWDETIANVQKIQQKELDSVMTTVINDAMVQITDRIENGDTIRDTKTGELVRIPMKGKELAVAAAVLFDKRSLIRGDATSIAGKRADPLKDIESKMMEFAKKVKSIK